MNKERLIQKMWEAEMPYGVKVPFVAIDILAEAAITLLDNEWVRVEEIQKEIDYWQRDLEGRIEGIGKDVHVHAANVHIAFLGIRQTLKLTPLERLPSPPKDK